MGSPQSSSEARKAPEITYSLPDVPLNERPDPSEVIYRALMRANRAMFTIDLQARRISSVEPEDREFLARREVDFEVLIAASRRLYRLAETTRTAIKELARADKLPPEHFSVLKCAGAVGEEGRARTASEMGRQITAALKEFKDKLPDLDSLRNVAEHIDDYSTGKGNLQKSKSKPERMDKQKNSVNVDRRLLEVCRISGNGRKWHWLGVEIDADDVLEASQLLFKKLKQARDCLFGE